MKKMVHVILCSVFCLTLLAGAESPGTTEDQIPPVVIASKKGVYTLKELHQKATALLMKKYKDFPSTAPSPIFEIIPNDQKSFVTVRYGGRIGQKYWAVSFDVNGQVTDHLSGIARDEIGQPRR